MYLLVLNAGSSSLRFQCIERTSWKQLFKGHVDGIGLKSAALRGDIERKVTAKNHTEALKIALETLKTSGILKSLNDIQAVGHRVVHGGEKYHAPTLITSKILKELEKISPLAPLHNPANIEGIKACMKLLPQTPQVAVFDTGFHATLPEHAYLYGLPYAYYRKHQIRKYGFHGTSHQFVSEQAITALKKNKKPHARIITCHIGNGVSLTAIKNGKSIDTSMGFTPLEGVVMGTRSGNFDPAILFHLMKKGISAKDLEHTADHESGLKGLSGVSSDVRPLRDIYFNAKHPKNTAVKRAFAVYAYRIAQTIGAYTVALGGLDALVFTAGIGENAWYLRRDICAPLAHLGVQLDANKNRRTTEGKTGPIHASKSKAHVFVIATNEELQIAKETARLV